jgi:hypothetical protein
MARKTGIVALDIVVGDRVKKRGFSHEGVVKGKTGTWCHISWDDGHLAKERPKICDVKELERIT